MSKVILKKPIQAHGETVKELTFQEPTLGVLDDIQLTVTGSGEVRINLGDVKNIVAALAGIPPSSAAQISLGDTKQMVPVIMGFFEEFLPTGES